MTLQDDATRELLARIATLAHDAKASEVHELAQALSLLEATGASKPTKAGSAK